MQLIIEILAVIFGIISVYLAVILNRHSWTFGIINVLLLAFVFFNVQLYSNVILQLFLLVVCIQGFLNWHKSNVVNKIEIKRLEPHKYIKYATLIVLCSFGLSLITANLHIWLPEIFTSEAVYLLPDAFIAVMSIFATIGLVYKIIESWHLWMLINAISVFVFFDREIYFLAGEYFIFLFTAFYGFYNWSKELK